MEDLTGERGLVGHHQDQRKRVAVITGASSGIGRAAAVGLARLGWLVALIGRDRGRLSAAAAQVRAAARGPAPTTHQADFTSFASVRELAEELAYEYRMIDVLANNAGAIVRRHQITADGREATMQTNHLSAYLLTNLLRDNLAPDGRIVTTASAAHAWAALDPSDLDGSRRPYRPWLTYGNSKAANILFAAEAARRWPSLLSFSFHPGIVATDFGTPVVRMFYRHARGLYPPEQGADTLVYLATAPSETLRNGAYYVKRAPARPSRRLADPALARNLWDSSASLVGL